MAGHSIKTIFYDHWSSAKQVISRRYSSFHWRSIVDAVDKMLSCKDPSGGYAEYICTRCGKEKRVAFTCKGRFCTSCGKKYIDEWVNKTVKGIINVAHRHIVFTIPQELRDKIFTNRKLIKVMMDCASRSALEVLQSRGTDAIPGIICVAHTFGRDLKFHCHIHLLLTEGGLTSEDSWEDIPFLPYDLLRKKWQYHLLTEIKKCLPKTRENASFINHLFRENAKGFYVNGESKMSSSRYTARYIGRYLARPALAEYRITGYDGREVIFWYKSHQTGNKVYKKLSAIEFIELLVDHIPPKGFKMVRRYGLYSRRSKHTAMEVLEGSKRFIQKSLEFISDIPAKLSWRERMIRSFGKDPLVCGSCHQEMELWRIWHPAYGTIYDLGRDSPAVVHEKKAEKSKVKTPKERPRRFHQLCLFPV